MRENRTSRHYVCTFCTYGGIVVHAAVRWNNDLLWAEMKRLLHIYTTSTMHDHRLFFLFFVWRGRRRRRRRRQTK